MRDLYSDETDGYQHYSSGMRKENMTGMNEGGRNSGEKADKGGGRSEMGPAAGAGVCPEETQRGKNDDRRGEADMFSLLTQH